MTSAHDIIYERIDEDENALADTLVKKFDMTLKEATELIRECRNGYPGLNKWRVLKFAERSIQEMDGRLEHVLSVKSEIEKTNDVMLEIGRKVEEGVYIDTRVPSVARENIKSVYRALREFFEVFISIDGITDYARRVDEETAARIKTADERAFGNFRLVFNLVRRHLGLKTEFEFMKIVERTLFETGKMDYTDQRDIMDLVKIAFMYIYIEHEGGSEARLRTLENYAKEGKKDILIEIARPGPRAYVIPPAVEGEPKWRERLINPTDIAIVEYIDSRGEATVREVAEHVKLSKEWIRKMLKNIEKAGLLKSVKEGNTILYSVV
jgi:DNA-binding Lrp family transcriptional regulator